MMNHPTIEDEGIVEQYVTGRLSVDEVTRFEQHYLECPACIQSIEDTERLQRGLARLAQKQTLAAAVQVGLFTRLKALGSRPRTLATLLTVFIVAGLPMWWMQTRVTILQDELKHSETERELALQPQINTSIIELAPFRSSSDPFHTFSLPSPPEWLVFTVPLEDRPLEDRPLEDRSLEDRSLQDQGLEEPTFESHSSVSHGAESYRAILKAQNRSTVWQASDLAPDPQGRVTISFYSTFLKPGEYQLRLIAVDGGTDRPVGDFRLRILPAPTR